MPRSTTALGELREGFDVIARLVGLTLGPSQGVVLNDVGGGSAESLVDSATIARRVTSFPGRRHTAGAELARALVRRVGDGAGDGGATAAVIARAVLCHAVRVVAAGANPVLVRAGIQRGVAIACDVLKSHATPVDAAASTATGSSLTGLALAATSDTELATVLGEMVDVLGVEGAISVEEHEAMNLVHHYVEGARWRGRPAESDLLPGASTELTLIDPVVAVVDEEVERVEQVAPILEAALAQPGRPPLLFVARELSGTALSMLSFNHRRGTLISAPTVITTSRTRVSDDLDDLALLTGAVVICTEHGRKPGAFQPSWFGRARRAVVQPGYLTVSGGRGDASAIAERAARLRTRAWELDQSPQREDRRTRDRLWLRQARLCGRVGVVRVGAATTQQVEVRVAQARKAIRLLHIAAREGIVPGGGVAYLDCVRFVRAAREDCTDSDVAAGLDAVCSGLEAPFLQIVRNAGETEPRVALAKVRELGPGHGIDVRRHAYVDMRSAGIWDAAGVAATALEAAGETAGLLVSAEVVTGRA